MKRKRHYWQAILFVAVLIIPSVYIVYQGWRNARLDQQTREAAAAQEVRDSRDAATAAIRGEMWDRLEAIKAQEIAGTSTPDRVVEFLGWSDGGNLIMPWNEDPNAEKFRQAIKEADFARRIEEAERAEFAEKHLERAEFLYRELAQTALGEHQRAYARLKLAPLLTRLGKQADADSIYRDLLSLPPDLVDQEGYSVASTAALFLSTRAAQDVLARVRRDLESAAVLTLDQTYRWRLVLQELRNSGGEEVAAALNSLEARVEMLERMKERAKGHQDLRELCIEYPTMGLTEKSWKMAGNNLLVSRASGAFHRSLVIAVRREAIFHAVRSARPASPPFSIITDGKSGQPLDEERLQGIRVHFDSVNTAGLAGFDPGRKFYVPFIVLVLSLNLFGGYLLWRDTRREVRVAELRSQFVSSVSHELKTPLTAIRMFGELLQAETPVDRETHEECVNTIVNESERLTRLLNNVLDFSRIEHGQKTYRLEPTILPEIVKSAAKTIQYPLAEQGFDLRMDIDERTPQVQADSDALKQAVLNLLTNAMKYSGQSRDISLRLFSENGDALIQVADRGIGIPDQEQSRIFEKFYRAPVLENQSISGTGLGLALVAHIVQGHGGTIEVQSAPGAGSTFSIRLPIHAGVRP